MDRLTLLQSIILGVIQGATEFLPVSSSGHLVVLQQLFGWGAAGNVQVAFDIILHLGTLVAVFVVLYKDIVGIIVNKDFKMILKLIVATLPAVAAVVFFKDYIDDMFTSVLTVAIAWLVTGTFLFFTRYISEHHENTDISFKQSLIIGCVQAISIIPGISRSGSTIAAGLFLKRERVLAAKFSFLMSIIAILGGAVIDAKDLQSLASVNFISIAAGFISSAIVGYFCVRWLLRLIVKGHFSIFAYYCWAIGLVTLYFYFK